MDLDSKKKILSSWSMATLSSWDEQGPPAGPPVGRQGGVAAESDHPAKPKPRAKLGADEGRRQPAAARARQDVRGSIPDGQHRGAGLGLVPQAGPGGPAQQQQQSAPSVARHSPTKAAAQGSPEKKKAYNPGKYVRVSNQSSYDAELFARSLKKGSSDAVPVVLSKNKLLANEILSPQLAKISPRVRISHALAGQDLSAARKKTRAMVSPVQGSLHDSVDAVVLKQLGLE